VFFFLLRAIPRFRKSPLFLLVWFIHRVPGSSFDFLRHTVPGTPFWWWVLSRLFSLFSRRHSLPPQYSPRSYSPHSLFGSLQILNNRPYATFIVFFFIDDSSFVQLGVAPAIFSSLLPFRDCFFSVTTLYRDQVIKAPFCVYVLLRGFRRLTVFTFPYNLWPPLLSTYPCFFPRQDC